MNASARILALALHRDAAGTLLPHRSSHLLAAALLDSEIACDALAVPWMPALPAADAAMSEAWGARTGHEGERHRHLRAGAAGLLAAWAPGAEIESERPRHGRGRRIRPDLEARVGGCAFLAEVGATEGDAVAALLLPGPRARGVPRDVPATHVVVLPFAGRRSYSARGYVFRRADAPALGSPTRPELRAAWAAFTRRAACRGPVA